MSWDIFVMDLPADAATMDDIPQDFEGRVLMSRWALIEGIKQVVPDADFSDPTWGHIDGPDYSIEVNVGDDDPLTGFAFHVRGDGDTAAGIVAAILRHFGLRAVDSSSDTGLFDPESAVESLRHWRAYRDHVVGDP